MATEREIFERAEALGREHGHAAATWVFDGNAERETYERVGRMINDGDPEVYDLYRSPLSGEYADDMTPSRLLEEIGAGAFNLDREADRPDFESEVCDVYEAAHSDAFWEEVERAIHYQLA